MENVLRIRILTIMRAFLLLLSIGLTASYGTSLAQDKMQIEVNNLSIKEFLEEVQRNSNYVFFYNDEVLNTNKKISLKLSDAALSTILDQAFVGTDLSYKVLGNQVVIKKDKKTEVFLPSFEEEKADPEEMNVSGTVTDGDGESLPGVSIVERGTTNGTLTDINGNYSITVQDDATLVFSYVGMLSKTVAVGNRSVIDVSLEEDVATLGEVVVVAYGTQKKESITGSVGTVEGETFEQVPVSTFEQVLRGSTAGVQATAVDGAPGGNTQVRIRGIGSITASSEPLYVIDGIPIQSGSVGTIDNNGTSTNVMAAINPNDIESISVLKDAASTAIYGSRGANGVILINTKSGQTGKAQVSIKALTGFNTQAYDNILRPLNAEQYTELFLEGYVNRGDTPAEAQARFDATFQ